MQPAACIVEYSLGACYHASRGRCQHGLLEAGGSAALHGQRPAPPRSQWWARIRAAVASIGAGNPPAQNVACLSVQAAEALWAGHTSSTASEVIPASGRCLQRVAIPPVRRTASRSLSLARSAASTATRLWFAAAAEVLEAAAPARFSIFASDWPFGDEHNIVHAGALHGISRVEPSALDLVGCFRRGARASTGRQDRLLFLSLTPSGGPLP